MVHQLFATRELAKMEKCSRGKFAFQSIIEKRFFNFNDARYTARLLQLQIGIEINCSLWCALLKFAKRNLKFSNKKPTKTAQKSDKIFSLSATNGRLRKRIRF